MGLFRKRSGRALECPVAHAIGADGVVIYVGDSALFANFAARFTVAGDTPYSVACQRRFKTDTFFLRTAI